MGRAGRGVREGRRKLRGGEYLRVLARLPRSDLLIHAPLYLPSFSPPSLSPLLLFLFLPPSSAAVLLFGGVISAPIYRPRRPWIVLYLLPFPSYPLLFYLLPFPSYPLLFYLSPFPSYPLLFYLLSFPSYPLLFYLSPFLLRPLLSLLSYLLSFSQFPPLPCLLSRFLWPWRVLRTPPEPGKRLERWPEGNSVLTLLVGEGGPTRS